MRLIWSTAHAKISACRGALNVTLNALDFSGCALVVGLLCARSEWTHCQAAQVSGIVSRLDLLRVSCERSVEGTRHKLLRDGVQA